MTASPAVLALTAGEPAGIGPDLCVLLAQRELPARIVVVADRDLLQQRAHLLRLPWTVRDFAAGASVGRAGGLEVLHVPLAAPATPGAPDPRNSAYVLETLQRAAAGCLNGEFGALVTAPLHKGVINDAGIPFTGHTEYLAQLTHAPHVVMMLAGGGLRVALATTHLPLREVPGAITRESLEATLSVLQHDLAVRFGIASPRILVAGLNPHAGEGGHLGSEEIAIIIPVLEKLRGAGCAVRGPLPADTLFLPQNLRECDCVLAMYHDQGLPVLKYAAFGGAVNVTLGLPIIRTSVDHGTALELAGSGKIESGSLLAAIETALAMLRHSRCGT